MMKQSFSLFSFYAFSHFFTLKFRADSTTIQLKTFHITWKYYWQHCFKVATI